jgi:hypothetical protein
MLAQLPEITKALGFKLVSPTLQLKVKTDTAEQINPQTIVSAATARVNL